jgi:predicted metalloprotease
MFASARCVDVESARFFEEMRNRLGDGGGLAEAHVIAHVRWFTRGLETGDMDRCATFSARSF